MRKNYVLETSQNLKHQRYVTLIETSYYIAQNEKWKMVEPNYKRIFIFIFFSSYVSFSNGLC
jgi:hypothetical protein